MIDQSGAAIWILATIKRVQFRCHPIQIFIGIKKLSQKTLVRFLQKTNNRHIQIVVTIPMRQKNSVYSYPTSIICIYSHYSMPMPIYLHIICQCKKHYIYRTVCLQIICNAMNYKQRDIIRTLESFFIICMPLPTMRKKAYQRDERLHE